LPNWCDCRFSQISTNFCYHIKKWFLKRSYH
jgi:hypothetical protein